MPDASSARQPSAAGAAAGAQLCACPATSTAPHRPAMHLERLVVRGRHHAHVGEQRQASACQSSEACRLTLRALVWLLACSFVDPKHRTPTAAPTCSPDACRLHSLHPMPFTHTRSACAAHLTESECAGMVCVHLPPDHTRMVQSPLPDSRSPLGSCSRHSTAASCPSSTCAPGVASGPASWYDVGYVLAASCPSGTSHPRHVPRARRPGCQHLRSRRVPARTARRARCGSSCLARRTQCHPPESPARQRPGPMRQAGRAFIHVQDGAAAADLCIGLMQHGRTAAAADAVLSCPQPQSVGHACCGAAPGIAMQSQQMRPVADASP